MIDNPSIADVIVECILPSPFLMPGKQVRLLGVGDDYTTQLQRRVFD
jgi:hypothetical protein